MINRRHALLLLLLCGLAVLFMLDRRSQGAIGTPEYERRVPDALPQSLERSADRGLPEILSIRARTDSAQVHDAFARRDWTPKSPPAPPTPIDAPKAPDLPFTYLGRQFAHGEWSVFLARKDRTFIAGIGDVIEDMYRIESIEPPVLTITYLPLREPQSLAIESDE